MTQLNNLKLSKRLQAIYDMVPQSNVIADIGSDHALLPIALVLNGKVTRAYASEVNEGPYEPTVKNIEKHGVSNYVSAVLSDGISELGKDLDAICDKFFAGTLLIAASCFSPILLFLCYSFIIYHKLQFFSTYLTTNTQFHKY